MEGLDTPSPISRQIEECIQLFDDLVESCPAGVGFLSLVRNISSSWAVTSQLQAYAYA